MIVAAFARDPNEAVPELVVRPCRITDCGQAGICGAYGGAFSTIEDCDISYCYWKKPYRGEEMGCIKLHAAIDVTIARCRLHHSNYYGIWLDWMAQGAAFVGNRMRGTYKYHNDKRRTPTFKPHSVTLDLLDAGCGQGAFTFINNILGNDPKFAKEVYKSRYEDNWMVPADCWKVDDATGECVITPPAGLKKPDFKPVDATRLGKPIFVDQEYPAPSVCRPQMP